MTSAAHQYVRDNRPPPTARPHQVWEFACSILRDGYFPAWADMFAEDGVLEIPLGGQLLPPRIEGREEIRRLLAPVQAKAYELHPGSRSEVTVHECTDSEVVICEFESVREERSTGNLYVMPYVHVVRVRNGEIVHMRDYAPLHLAPPSVTEVVAELGRTAS